MAIKIQMHGIKNCDTVRKAIRWLMEKNIDCDFHDLKKEVPDQELIGDWLLDIDKDKLINKRGLTWRNIPTEEKSLNDQAAIIELIRKYPTVVKRPVLYSGSHWSVGFKPEDWDELFL